MVDGFIHLCFYSLFVSISCFSTYVGLSMYRLCCYCCVSMDTLSHVAALCL